MSIKEDIEKFGFKGSLLEGLSSIAENVFDFFRVEVFSSLEALNASREKLSSFSLEYDYESLMMVLLGALHAKSRYIDLQIDEKVYYETMNDIFVWCDNYSRMHEGKIGLLAVRWLLLHINLKLFRLGRLQFERGPVSERLRDKVDASHVYNVHIPEIGPLEHEDVEASFRNAMEFFKEKKACFVCESWLLETDLRKVLSPGSNILKFQNMFRITSVDKTNRQCEERVFGNTAFKGSSLQNRIREEEARGTLFGVGCGFRIEEKQ